MNLAKTDRDELCEEIYSLIANVIAITEAPDEYGLPVKVKARAIKELTDDTFHSILRKITKQRDRAVALSRN